MECHTGTISNGEDEMKLLLEAATSGDAAKLKNFASSNPEILLGKTLPRGSTCLHVSSAFGHEEFSKAVVELNPSLLSTTNFYEETPLIVAITSGRVNLASALLKLCEAKDDTNAILADDKYGNNALHHAICNGHRDIALELIKAEPALSEEVNHYHDSPMFLAIMRGTNFSEVTKQLLEISTSSDEGGNENNALHAAVRIGNPEITEMVMKKRPTLARGENNIGNTPLREAVIRNKIEVVRTLLTLDQSLGYHISKKDSIPILISAASNGHVEVAEEVLKHCPDADYCAPWGMTCLHVAASEGHVNFVKFLLASPILHKLINLQDSNGRTALHYAVEKQNPQIVRALLAQKDINITIHDRVHDSSAFSQLSINDKDSAKTLKWNEVFTLMFKADPYASSTEYRKHAKREITTDAMNKVKDLTKSYTESTSVVAMLITTLTFAAAFTLPGGYSTDTGSEGLPLLVRKLAFKAFLISDTLAMCSSLAVTFICINISRREDYEFLLYYISFSKMLMWFSYVTTTVAFATGLYTVLAPQVLWLAILVCALSFVFPALALLLGQWPILRLRFQLGRSFKPDILDMV